MCVYLVGGVLLLCIFTANCIFAMFGPSNTGGFCSVSLQFANRSMFSLFTLAKRACPSLSCERFIPFNEHNHKKRSKLWK